MWQRLLNSFFSNMHFILRKQSIIMKFYLMVAQLMVFRSQIYNFFKHLINLIRLISIIGFTAKLEKTHAQKRIADPILCSVALLPHWSPSPIPFVHYSPSHLCVTLPQLAIPILRHTASSVHSFFALMASPLMR